MPRSRPIIGAQRTPSPSRCSCSGSSRLTPNASVLAVRQTGSCRCRTAGSSQLHAGVAPSASASDGEVGSGAPAQARSMPSRRLGRGGADEPDVEGSCPLHRCQRNETPGAAGPFCLSPPGVTQAQSEGMHIWPRGGGRQCRLIGADRHWPDKRMRSWLAEAAGPGRHRPPCDRVGDGGQRSLGEGNPGRRAIRWRCRGYSTFGGFRIDQQVSWPVQKLASRASAPLPRTRVFAGRAAGRRRTRRRPVGCGRRRCSSAVSRSAEAAVLSGGQITPVSRRAPRGVRSVRRYPLQGFPSSARQRSVPAV